MKTLRSDNGIPVIRPKYSRRFLPAIVCSLLLASCETVAPIIHDAILRFGQNVLSSASRNISPQYASDLEQLFIALVKQQTGLELTPTGDRQYGQNAYGYGNNNPQDTYGNGYGGQQDAYGYGGGNQQNAYGNNNSQDTYGNGYGGQQDSYGYGSGSQQEGFSGFAGSNGQDSYGGGSQQQGFSGFAGPGSQDGNGYGNTQQDAYGYGGNTQDAYGYTASNQNGSQPRYRSARPPITMDVGLLAQRKQPDGSVNLEAIQDGAVLYDGRGDPQAGDKLKITFKTNCDCYVYIIGIDATGYVAQVFPDPDYTTGNPVEADRQYTLPEDNSWWGLDEYRGTETVYFVASHTQRADIEAAIAKLAGTERRVAADYQPVREAAVIPQTRGLVKVRPAPPTTVNTESGSAYEVTPTAFSTAVSGVDLVITRWFSHQ